MLQPWFELAVARNGRDALRLVRRQPPDLVLLDIEMPGLDGLAVCRRLKDDPLTEEIPVVFLTSSTDQSIEERGLTAGAADFIAKPARGPVVVARLSNLVRMKQQAEQLRRQAQIDGLTGLANRRHFNQMLLQELRRAWRNRQPVSLLMIDVDHFKAYNDHYGHLGGDGALRRVGLALQGIARRPGDLACRYGGEEFAIVLPATDEPGACVVAKATLAAVNALGLPHAASSVAPHVTLSIGVATLQPQAWPDDHNTDFAQPQEDAIERLVGQADAALYEAKRQGRNQAWVHGPAGCVWAAGLSKSSS